MLRNGEENLSTPKENERQRGEENPARCDANLRGRVSDMLTGNDFEKHHHADAKGHKQNWKCDPVEIKRARKIAVEEVMQPARKAAKQTRQASRRAA